MLRFPMAEKPTVRRYGSLDEMKADEYRYWQSRPGHERLDAVEQMIEMAYAVKGWKAQPDEPRRLRGHFGIKAERVPPGVGWPGQM